MKSLLTFVASLFCVAGVNAASPSFSSFYTNHFTTNNLVIKAKLNTNQFDTSTSSTNITITITNVSGVGGLLWTNDTSIGSSGRLMPVPGLSYAFVYPSNFYNHGWFTLQPEFHLLGSGTNTIGVEESSHLMFSMTNDPTEVIITLESGFAMGQELLLMSYTNTVFNGRFTLPADSVVSGGGLVKLNNNEDWLGANGSAIRLIWIEPDWWEQGRWTAGSNVTSDVIWENVNGLGVIQPRGGQITNALQFISGSADAATNTLLTLDTVVGWTDDNAKMVDLRRQGTNVAYWTPWGSLEIGRSIGPYWLPSSDDILAGVHNVEEGESDYAILYAGAIDGVSATNYSEFSATLNTGASPASVLTLASVATNLVSSLNVLLQPDQGVARITLANQGATTFFVDDNSGYAGAGVKALLDNGTYGPTSGFGTTINPTDNYLPVRTSATAFGDSPLFKIDANTVAFSMTNALIRDGSSLVYSNTSQFRFIGYDPAPEMIITDLSGDTATFGMNAGGNAYITSSGLIYFGKGTVHAGDIYPQAGNTVNAGQIAVTGQIFRDVVATNLYSRGSLDGTGATIFKITHGGPGNPVTYDSTSTIAGTGASPHLWTIGTTNVAKFDNVSAATETRFWIYDEDNGTMERVSVGAPDSGGIGFKVLRIAN